MRALTKDEIARLSPEQQVDLARLEASQAGKRERLLKQARGSEFLLFSQATCLAIALGSVVYARFPWPLLLCLCALIVAVAIGLGSAKLRMDALLSLDEMEKDEPLGKEDPGA